MRKALKELDLGCKLRQVRENVVEGYAERMGEGDVFPPVSVVQEGKQYFVYDGFHRIAAAALRGDTEIEVTVQAGTMRDAFLLTVKANAQNGVFRTNADKRAAVLVLLTDEEWSKWSNCEIAREALVSEGLVRKVKAEMPDTSYKTKWGWGKVRGEKVKCGDGRFMSTGWIGRRKHKAPDGTVPPIPAEEISPEAAPPQLALHGLFRNPLSTKTLTSLRRAWAQIWALGAVGDCPRKWRGCGWIVFWHPTGTG